jgi:hypothetical protein
LKVKRKGIFEAVSLQNCFGIALLRHCLIENSTLDGRVLATRKPMEKLS